MRPDTPVEELHWPGTSLSCLAQVWWLSTCQFPDSDLRHMIGIGLPTNFAAWFVVLLRTPTRRFTDFETTYHDV